MAEPSKAEPAKEAPSAAEAQPENQKVARKRVAKAIEAKPKEEIQHMTDGILLFGKYSYGIEILDPSLKNYINLKPSAYPVSYRRTSQKGFSKASINIIERLANSLMRGGTGGKIGGHVIRTKGRLQGKKLKTTKIIEEAFENIHKQTGNNPIQILVKALENSAPIEDTTRVIYGGITSNVAVDISASRRLDIALRDIAMAAILGAFGSKRTISQALANELMLAANGDINSYAIKRKNEIERMARSAK